MQAASMQGGSKQAGQAASRQSRQQRCGAGSSMQAEQAACRQGKQLTRSCSLRPRSVRPMARAGSPEGRTSICLRCATCHKAQGGRGLHAGCTFAMASGDQNAWCGCCTASCTMQVMPQCLRQLPRRLCTGTSHWLCQWLAFMPLVTRMTAVSPMGSFTVTSNGVPSGPATA